MNSVEKNIKDFVVKLIENNNPNEIKDFLRQYLEFLINTKTISSKDDIALWVLRVIENLDIIEMLKEKNGKVNLDLFFKSVGLLSLDGKSIDNKHYKHYSPPYEDDSWGYTRRYTSSSCGTERTSDSC